MRLCEECGSEMFKCGFVAAWNCIGCGRTLNVIPKGEKSQMFYENYWEHVLPTYIENWPNGLHNLSVPSLSIPMFNPTIFLAAYEKIVDGKDLSDEENTALGLQRKAIDEAAKQFPKGFFVRLGSRSPKDSWFGHEKGFKCLDGAHAMRLLLDSPDRIYDDVALAVSNQYQPRVWLRDWVDIPDWAEFRCFMRNKQIVGVSQYDYLEQQRHDEIADDADSIKWAIDRFFRTLFLPVIHLDDVVFDVWAIKRTRGSSNERTWEVRLLEINPFGIRTDPCLFSWQDGGDFDGSFRFIKESATKPNIEDLMIDLVPTKEEGTQR